MAGPVAKVSSNAIEILGAWTPQAKVSQHVVEVLWGFSAPTAPAVSPLIPAMTSNTAPSGTVTYSSQYYAGWQAFSQNIVSHWGWLSNGATPQWLSYQFPTAKTVRSYEMRQYGENYNLGNRRAKSWIFQGSTDGNTWVDLDTRTDYVWPTDWNDRSSFMFEIASPASYAYYRIYVTASWGDTSYVGIGSLQMWDNTDVYGTVSQDVIEVLLQHTPSVRVGQTVVEVLTSGDGYAGGSSTPTTHTFGSAT
jgi:hypothetical protein